MKLIDKIMDTLKLYDEDDDILDEELEVKKPFLLSLKEHQWICPSL